MNQYIFIELTSLKFTLTFHRSFGDLSLEGDNEKEILDNFKRLEKLQSTLAKLFGSDVEIPAEIVQTVDNRSNTEKVLIALSHSIRPLERKDYIKLSERLGVPRSWWNGSNFQRDLKKLPRGLTEKVRLPNQRSGLKITQKGKKYVKSLTKPHKRFKEQSEEKKT